MPVTQYWQTATSWRCMVGQYYTPLSGRLDVLKQQYKDDQEVQIFISSLEKRFRSSAIIHVNTDILFYYQNMRSDINRQTICNKINLSVVRQETPGEWVWYSMKRILITYLSQNLNRVTSFKNHYRSVFHCLWLRIRTGMKGFRFVFRSISQCLSSWLLVALLHSFWQRVSRCSMQSTSLLSHRNSGIRWPASVTRWERLPLLSSSSAVWCFLSALWQTQ